MLSKLTGRAQIPILTVSILLTTVHTQNIFLDDGVPVPTRPPVPKVFEAWFLNTTAIDDYKDCFEDFVTCMSSHKKYPICGIPLGGGETKVFEDYCELVYENCLGEFGYRGGWNWEADEDCTGLGGHVPK